MEPSAIRGHCRVLFPDLRGACHRARIRATRWLHPGYARESSRIIAAPFSAIMAVGVLVLPDVIVGITEASAMRSPDSPKKRKRSSTTAEVSLAIPIFAVPTG